MLIYITDDLCNQIKIETYPSLRLPNTVHTFRACLSAGAFQRDQNNNVSYDECLRHYRDLCLPAMHKDDFILLFVYFVIDTLLVWQKLNWISKEQIIKHSNRISVDKWKEITGNTAMNPILREQYKVNVSEFEHLLLSPRSKKEWK